MKSDVVFDLRGRKLLMWKLCKKVVVVVLCYKNIIYRNNFDLGIMCSGKNNWY